MGVPLSQAERRKIERGKIEREVIKEANPEIARHNALLVARQNEAAKARREAKSESTIKRPGHPDANVGPLSGNNTEQGRANSIDAELNEEFRQANGRGPSSHDRANIRRQAEHLARQGYTG